MQELVLVLSSLAGIATAAAVRGRPRGGRLPSIGASPRIKSQVESLGIEKDILAKTIARLHQSDSGITRIQKDRLLLRYQHQHGVILAKMDRLKEAGRHPDLGPVGDGLITLMDQRLSGLDERMREISSRIAVKEPEKEAGSARRAKKPEPVEIPAEPRQAFELTTLTNIPRTEMRADPWPVQGTKQAVLEPVQIVAKKPVQRAQDPAVPQVPVQDPVISQIQNPQEPPDTDEKELEEIKHSITKVLSKLDQAEVE